MSIIKFAASALVRESGAKVEFDEFYLDYWQHCKAINGRAMTPTEAVEQTNRLCKECNIQVGQHGKKRYLVGVRLKTSQPKRTTKRVKQ